MRAPGEHTFFPRSGHPASFQSRIRLWHRWQTVDSDQAVRTEAINGPVDARVDGQAALVGNLAARLKADCASLTFVDGLRSSSRIGGDDDLSQIGSTGPQSFTNRVLVEAGALIETPARGLELIAGAPVDPGRDGEAVLAVGFRRRPAATEAELSQTLSQAVTSAELTLSSLSTLRRRRDLTDRDPLTGCLNLFALLEALDREVDDCKRSARPLSVCSVDLDRFRRVNDVEGHPRGNEVPAAVGDALLSAVRATDYVGRYGGDEFVIVLPETTSVGAHLRVESISATIESVGVDLLGAPLECSVGIAEWRPELSSKAMLEAAHEAMRTAKSGEHSVVSYESTNGGGARSGADTGNRASRAGDSAPWLSLGALPCGDELVEDSRRRLEQSLTGREWRSELTMALGFLVAATMLALLVPSDRVVSWPAVLALTGLLTLFSRIRFEVGGCRTSPIQLAFVPMVLLLPPAMVPFLVALGFSLDKGVDISRGRIAPERGVMALADSWFTIGPVVVIGLAAAGDPSWAQWPIYVAALGAQFFGDAVVSWVREYLHRGVSLVEQALESAWIYLIDALLSPIGLVVAIAAVSEGYWSVMLVAPLTILLAIFAQERSAHIDSMLALRDAYRGTARVLGDVVEHDDAYTGEHTRGVTELSLGVAHELKLDAARCRNVEFGAILHDVGKIAVPKRIVNKRGPLTDREWELMKRHTIEAQQMLNRIGGLMTEVGLIVRSAHERYDGGGYPDGLVADQIPLESRIIFACDAFNAITTDRPYRRARTEAEALSELNDHAGSQFDPAVVAALIATVTGRLSHVSAEAEEISSAGVPTPAGRPGPLVHAGEPA